MVSDVLIIGGGVIGLACARELAGGGATVTLLERGACGEGASGAAAGMLAPQAEADSADDFFRLCDESNRMYDAFVGGLFDETGIDPELDNSGTIFPAMTARDSAEIVARFEWQTRAGLAVERLSAQETRRLEPFISPDVRESLLFPNDRQVDPRRLVAALKRACELRGVKIVEGVEVSRILDEFGSAAGVVANGEVVSAGAVVVAAGAWASALAPSVPAVRPVRGQVIELRPAKRVFERVIYSSLGYLVPRADGRLLVGATVEEAGFDNTTTPSGIESLRRAALELAPSLANLKVADAWSGLRPAGEGHLPFIGKVPGVGNLYAATGHYRNGILLAPVTAARLAAEF